MVSLAIAILVTCGGCFIPCIRSLAIRVITRTTEPTALEEKRAMIPPLVPEVECNKIIYENIEGGGLL